MLLSAIRTPIGKFGGALGGIAAPMLGACAIKEAIHRAGIAAEDVDEVIMGCVLQAGLGQNPARQAAIHAGLPQSTPATTVNVVCGSGLKSVLMGVQAIRAGECDVVVAGGMENMSSAPYALPNARFGYRMNDGTVKDLMVHDALWDAYGDYHMGITAENIARRFSISREEQDAFAVHSQNKCEAAVKEGRFRREIVPVEIRRGKESILFDRDENPRAGVTMESVSRLKPAFLENGTVTAANASNINDGAAAVVLMRGDKARQLGLRPIAQYVSGGSVGVDPAYMGLGAGEAALAALEKARLKVRDLSRIEANEAFAAQSIACARLAGWDSEDMLERVNVNGGAIALGHPVGASGCRILVTLLHELQRTGGYGLATLCVGGGMGVSAIFRAQ